MDGCDAEPACFVVRLFDDVGVGGDGDGGGFGDDVTWADDAVFFWHPESRLVEVPATAGPALEHIVGDPVVCPPEFASHVHVIAIDVDHVAVVIESIELRADGGIDVWLAADPDAHVVVVGVEFACLDDGDVLIGDGLSEALEDFVSAPIGPAVWFPVVINDDGGACVRPSEDQVVCLCGASDRKG